MRIFDSIALEYACIRTTTLWLNSSNLHAVPLAITFNWTKRRTEILHLCVDKFCLVFKSILEKTHEPTADTLSNQIWTYVFMWRPTQWMKRSKYVPTNTMFNCVQIMLPTAWMRERHVLTLLLANFFRRVFFSFFKFFLFTNLAHGKQMNSNRRTARERQKMMRFKSDYDNSLLIALNSNRIIICDEKKTKKKNSRTKNFQTQSTHFPYCKAVLNV